MPVLEIFGVGGAALVQPENRRPQHCTFVIHGHNAYPLAADGNPGDAAHSARMVLKEGAGASAERLPPIERVLLCPARTRAVVLVPISIPIARSGRFMCPPSQTQRPVPGYESICRRSAAVKTRHIASDQ